MARSRRRLRAVVRGSEGERHVARLLAQDGWKLRATNVLLEGGELDLVVERHGVWRFVEVKSRADGSGIDAIDRRKRGHLRRAGEAWLCEHGEPEREVAFLVAVVDLATPGWPVEWWDDPF